MLLRAALLTISAVLLIDQVSKFLVKLNMLYSESIPVLGNWFYIHFIENPGMAFGLEFGGDYGKIILSIFRILSVIAIGWYLRHLLRKKSRTGLIVSIALIFSGALGNIIDSAFYGIIFSESSPFATATLFPEGGGYAPFLQGRVVDMLYFPLFEVEFPQWVPFLAGNHFTFFQPVFNVADSAITVGILMLLLFQKRYYAA